MDIPYELDPRPDTGFTNGRLGLWLFLASEAMFFGALVSGYALLRAGSEAWPVGSARLNLPLGVVSTIVLAGSSVTATAAVRRVRAGAIPAAVRLAIATALAGALFLALEAAEWAQHLGAGHRPASDTFDAAWFTLTGLHGLHVAGGVAVLAWIAARRDARLSHRIPLAMLYWLFVDLVWIVLFVLFYLT